MAHLIHPQEQQLAKPSLDSQLWLEFENSQLRCPTCKGPIELFTSTAESYCISCQVSRLRFLQLKLVGIQMANIFLLVIIIALTPFMCFARTVAKTDTLINWLEKKIDNIGIVVSLYLLLCIPFALALFSGEIIRQPSKIYQNWKQQMKQVQVMKPLDLFY